MLNPQSAANEAATTRTVEACRAVRGRSRDINSPALDI
jgi:hypothetical protein